jgi:hypothetical protein
LLDGGGNGLQVLQLGLGGLGGQLSINTLLTPQFCHGVRRGAL